ncbi:MAG TPA: class I SAM-dependent methyltransferase [Mycobacterium sp.]|nr:class I SAM-dependent methyltransferase [Mycobacterium sp.]HUH71032.1 class I SAM-dependent methyltransferase [Mycobacterium sp.]
MGCGTGENALYLASRGHTLVGLDGSAAAIAHAQTKARQRGIDAEFAQADARELAGYRGRFDTVIGN